MDFYKSTIEQISKYINEGLIVIDKEGNIIIINDMACELLELDSNNCIGKKVYDVVSESKLIQTVKSGIKELNQRLVIKDRKFLTNRLPIIIDGEVEGAFATFWDITVYSNLQKQIYEDKLYIDILDTILETAYEWVVVVDENGLITLMSKAYKEFVNDPHPEGKLVTDVIPNTRMHIVLQTGKPEIGDIQEINSKRMIAMRVPIKKNGKIVGAIGKVMFKDISDFYVLSKKLDNLEKEIEYYKNELGKERKAKYSFDDIVGESIKINELKKMAKKVAEADSNVLIFGESGTGKELYAHAIHNSSRRYLGPFVKLNCAAIPAELLESELFGYEEGAFTGAKKEGKKGKFELANGGTIFLDEIGDMPLPMQVKLLRVIQEKEIERVGGNTLKKIDVRIIAATNKNLEELVKEKLFREDLYYRLNVVKLSLPPLRERKEDISYLADALRKKVANKLSIYVEGISKEAMECMQNYDWPGNIRELENVIERALVLLDSDIYIQPEHLPERLTNNKVKYHRDKNKYLKDIIEDIESEIIMQCLKETGWNKNKTAKLLGVSRAGLYKKIEQYKLEDV